MSEDTDEVLALKMAAVNYFGCGTQGCTSKDCPSFEALHLASLAHVAKILGRLAAKRFRDGRHDHRTSPEALRAVADELRFVVGELLVEHNLKAAVRAGAAEEC